MKRILAFSTLAMVLGLATAASAQEAFTSSKAQVAGRLALGLATDDDENEPNPYGFGIGAKAGYTLSPNIYLGGVFEFFFGETEDVEVLGIGVPADVSANAWVLQAEVGYDFGLSHSLVLRPKLGLGTTQISTEVCNDPPAVLGVDPDEVCEDDSDGEFAFSIGLEAPIDLGGFFVSPEMRFHLVDDANAFILAVNLGAML